MELVLVVLLIAIVIGIMPPFDRGKSVEETWPEASFE
jgi:hypothetical protein